MIDKSLRKATAERYGDMIVVHMHGGGDCLWLNMYLDGATGQMTCDSDIGSYAYHWGRHIDKRKSWLDFCGEGLSFEEWLLRKCGGERKAESEFDSLFSMGGTTALKGELSDLDDFELISYFVVQEGMA